jgi:hypothetical protein
VQDDGGARHPSDIDIKPYKINVLIRSEDGFTEDGDSDFESVCVGTRWESDEPSFLLAVFG